MSVLAPTGTGLSLPAEARRSLGPNRQNLRGGEAFRRRAYQMFPERNRAARRPKGWLLGSMLTPWLASCADHGNSIFARRLSFGLAGPASTFQSPWRCRRRCPGKGSAFS